MCTLVAHRRSSIKTVLHQFTTALQNHCQTHNEELKNTHSSSLSKPAAYITHNATQPQTVLSEIRVCHASSGSRRDEGRATEVW